MKLFRPAAALVRVPAAAERIRAVTQFMPSDVAEPVMEEECRALLPTMRALARLDEQLRQETAALRGCETGTVRIGCIYGIYYDWLAQVIAAFSAIKRIRQRRGYHKEYIVPDIP